MEYMILIRFRDFRFEEDHFDTCEKIVRASLASDFFEKSLQRIRMLYLISVMRKSILLQY